MNGISWRAVVKFLVLVRCRVLGSQLLVLGWFVVLDFTQLLVSLDSWFLVVPECRIFFLRCRYWFLIVPNPLDYCRRITSEEGDLLLSDLKAVAPYDEEAAKLVAALENFRYGGMEMGRLGANCVTNCGEIWVRV